MPKVVSRGVVSAPAPAAPDQSKITILYCLCAEVILVLGSALASLPRRPTDDSYCLTNDGPAKRVYKLNVEEGTEASTGTLVFRGEGKYELQRRLHCPRCQLIVGYETKPGKGQKESTPTTPGSRSAVRGMIVLHLLSYFAAFSAFCFVTLSLASGLLYLAEVIEENSRTAKLVGQRTIYCIIALLVALNVIDGFPMHLTVLGIACHLVYLQNFSRNWPCVSIFSWQFILSCILVFVNHFAHFFYFSQRAAAAPRGGYGRNYNKPASSGGVWHRSKPLENLSFMQTLSFFGILIWLIPLFLFLSLSANENVLPTSGESSAPSTPSRSRDLDRDGLGAYPPATHRRKPSSIVKSAFNSLTSFVRPPPPNADLSSRRGSGLDSTRSDNQGRPVPPSRFPTNYSVGYSSPGNSTPPRSARAYSNASNPTLPTPLTSPTRTLFANGGQGGRTDSFPNYLHSPPAIPGLQRHPLPRRNTESSLRGTGFESGRNGSSTDTMRNGSLMEGFESYPNGSTTGTRREESGGMENVTLLENSAGDNGGATVRRKFG